MFLYTRPHTLICPVCESVMLGMEQRKYACVNAKCRMYRRWFEVSLPLVTAHACSPPDEAFAANPTPEAHPS